MISVRSHGATIALSAAAAFALWWSLAWDMGLSPDSMFYLKQSTGLLESFSVSRFEDKAPPLYPLFQYFSLLFVDDTFSAIKALHVVIYGVNTFLFAYIVFHLSGGSRFLATIAVLAHVCSATTLTMHSYALTEPLFVTFFLLALLFMYRYFLERAEVWLLAAGCAVGMLLLTRFASVSFLASVALFILLAKRKEGLAVSARSCATFVLPAVLLPGAWMVLKFFLDPSADAPRTLQYHPISIGQVLQMFEVLGGWLHLDVSTFLFLALFLLLVHMTYVRLKAGGLQFPAFLAFNAGFYLLFIAVSKSFFDAYIPIDQRILLPVLYLMLLFVFDCVREFINLRGDLQGKMEVGAFFGLLLVFGAVSAWTVAKQNYFSGNGFASRELQELRLHGLVKESDVERVYTNAPELVRLYAGREGVLLPHFFEPSSRVSNEAWVDEVSAVLQAVDEERAAIVYYSAVNWRTYLPTPEFFIEQYGLVPEHSTAEGAIFKGPLR